MIKNLIDRLSERNPLYTSLWDRLKLKKPAESECELKYIPQQSDWDCGQTSLDMLGYDGHRMFPDVPLTYRQTESIKGVESVYADSYKDEKGYREGDVFFFDKPAMLDVVVPGLTEGHFVVGYKDKVYCPSLGVFYANDYLTRVFIPHAFTVPFNELSPAKA